MEERERPRTMSSAVEEKMMNQRGGLASVKGSSETMRMILLSFAAIGITYELAHSRPLSSGEAIY